MSQPIVVRLGVDYGTSTSKLVLRNPHASGGEKAFLLRHGNDFRVSSSVLFLNNELHFGRFPNDRNSGTWFHSVKMRVAGEVTGDYKKYYYGTLSRLPTGITAQALATLTMWFLLTQARRNISRLLAGRAFRIAVTVGLPMSFYDDSFLRNAFLRIVAAARWLTDNCQPLDDKALSVDDARHFLFRVPPDVERGIDGAEVREWIRSEAEAAMCLAVKSPAVADGPFAEIDVGAGTTNATVFSILPQFIGRRWLKDRLGFFGAHSMPVGMDAIDDAIAKSENHSERNGVDYRGEEKQFVSGSASPYQDVLSGIRDAYLSAYQRGFRKFSIAEASSFRNHQVFITGGGSLLPAVTERFRKHASNYSDQLKIRKLDVPLDFWDQNGKRVSQEDLTFLAAAYGLSFDAAEVPEADSPAQTRAAGMPERARLNWEDM